MPVLVLGFFPLLNVVACTLFCVIGYKVILLTVSWPHDLKKNNPKRTVPVYCTRVSHYIATKAIFLNSMNHENTCAVLGHVLL